MSNLSAFGYIQERSEATPGLFNLPLSIISANIAALDSGLTSSSPSGNTFSFLTNIETSGGAHFQHLSIGSTPPSYATTAAITVEVNSAYSDYMYFVDSSAQKSSYILGSRAGGLADGLNIWDVSAGTMIASFSKQSIRFFQQVVGPVFDLGGALTGTYNAATFGTASQSTETRIQAAINQASIDGVRRVYLPSSMYPYSASSMSFIYTVQMVREGGRWDVNDALAYGAFADGAAASASTSNTSAINAMLSASSRSLPAYIPAGDYSHRGIVLRNQNVTLFGERSHPYADDPRVGGTFLRHVTDNVDGFLVELTQVNPFSINYQITIRDLGLYGPGPTSGKTGHGFFFRSTLTPAGYGGYVTLERVGVRRTNEHGIFFGGAWFGPFISNVWANACGGNGLRASRRLSSTEAAGSDQSDLMAESNAEHVNIFNCGATATTYDTICGLYWAPGSTNGPSRFDRLSSSGNSGSGAIIARCHVSGSAWQFESNGGSGGTRASLILGDTAAGYDINGATVGSIDVDYNTQATYAGNGIEIARGYNVALGEVSFTDSTTSYDIKIFSGATDTKILGATHLSGSATGGRYVDAGYRSFILTDGVLRLPPIVGGADATDVAFNWKRSDSGNSIWGIHLDNNDWYLRDVSNGIDVLRITRNPIPQILAVSGGDSSRPGWAYHSDRSLGFYQSGASTIGLSYGALGFPVGSKTSPSFNYSSESSLGLYRSGVSTMGLSYGAFNLPDGSNTTPSIGFSSNTSLGLYSSGVQTIAQSYGTFNLATNAVRLSMRTLATSSVTASAANTNVATNEVVFTIGGASGASFCISSGGTTYIFSSTASAKNT